MSARAAPLHELEPAAEPRTGVGPVAARELLERAGDRVEPVDAGAALAGALAGEVAGDPGVSATPHAEAGRTTIAPAPSDAPAGRRPAAERVSEPACAAETHVPK